MARSNSSPSLFTPLLTTPSFSLVNDTVALFAGLFDFSVPEGYQNETGFHFGRADSGSRPPTEGQNWLGEHI